MDALHAIHFYLDGRRNSRSLPPKSKMIGTEHPVFHRRVKRILRGRNIIHVFIDEG